MKCQNCGKDGQGINSICPHCNEAYSLKEVLTWIVEEKGEDTLTDGRAMKSYISDICRDVKYDTFVFEGLLSQGFSKKVYELFKCGNIEDGLDTYCRTLAATYNIDKINYIADAFYYALTRKNRVYKSVPPSPIITNNTSPNNTQSSPISKTPASTAQDMLSDVVSKIQSFDFQKFFANFNVQSIKSLVQKNKKVSIGVAGVIALIIVISIFSSIAGNISEKKAENTTSSNSSYESNDYIENDDNGDDENVYTPSYDYLTENSVSDVVYQGSVKEYYIKSDNPGIYRFTATDRTANYNVYIKAYNLNEDRVLDITNEGSCTLDANGTYKVTVETDSPSCSYTLNINRPNEVKTLSKETNTLHDSIIYI